VGGDGWKLKKSTDYCQTGGGDSLEKRRGDADGLRDPASNLD